MIKSLTPAALKWLRAAAEHDVVEPTYGPMTQLVEASFAVRVDEDTQRVRITNTGREYLRTRSVPKTRSLTGLMSLSPRSYVKRAPRVDDVVESKRSGKLYVVTSKHHRDSIAVDSLDKGLPNAFASFELYVLDATSARAARQRAERNELQRDRYTIEKGACGKSYHWTVIFDGQQVSCAPTKLAAEAYIDEANS